MSSSAEEDWAQAYRWLCRQRCHAPANSDVWHLRFHWAREGKALLARVQAGGYRLCAMRIVRNQYQVSIALWDAQDALVLKWVALRIARYLPLHRLCLHVKGHGARDSLRRVREGLSQGKYRYVYRTDIRGYYRAMRKTQVESLVRHWVPNPVLCELVRQFLHYSVEDGGEFFTPASGISRGCALSPLLGASVLTHVDEYFAAQPALFYVRYMDDFLLLSDRRWPIRRAVSRLKAFFDLGGFEAHPDKTQLGRVEKGFDWLGVWYGPEGLSIAPRAIENHRVKRLRLYEQARTRGLSEAAAQGRVRAYEARWNKWAAAIMAAGRRAGGPVALGRDPRSRLNGHRRTLRRRQVIRRCMRPSIRGHVTRTHGGRPHTATSDNHSA